MHNQKIKTTTQMTKNASNNDTNDDDNNSGNNNYNNDNFNPLESNILISGTFFVWIYRGKNLPNYDF